MCMVYFTQEYVGLVEFGTQGACSIAEAYRAGRTERARKTYICEVMEERFRER